MCVEHTESHPAIQVKRDKAGLRRAQWKGLMTCGHVWTCPVCSQNIRAKRAERIGAAVRGLGGRWQMLTVTLRHRNGVGLAGLLRGLMAAWRRTRQGGRIQRVWSERVSASARATDITHGGRGWHPHLHILLCTSEWSEDERAALLVRFREAIRRELGDAFDPSDEHALCWSDGFDAADSHEREFYLAKLGLEVAGVAKEGRRGNSTHWDVARRATEGDKDAAWLWREFQAATRGRRMLELDDRAAAAAERQLELESADKVAPEGPVDSVRYEVKRDDVRALRRAERNVPTIFADALRIAEREGGEALEAFLSHWRQHGVRRCVQSPAPRAQFIESG